MSLSALDSVDDALEATKRFLIPWDRARWFRLAVIMFFISGVGANVPNVPTGGFGGPTDPGTGPGPGPEPGPDTGPDPGAITPEITPELVALLIGLALLFVAVALLWAIAGAVMEFVFVESLNREHVKLWTYFKRNWWRGVRLWAFRFITWVLTLGLLAGLLLAVGIALGGWPIGQWTVEVAFALVLLGLPLFIGAIVVLGILLGFTNMFVVPVMYTEERGVIGSWRRFWPTLKREWKEFLVYLIVSILLGFAIGIAAGFLALLALIVVGIPFAVVGIPLVLVLGFDGLGAAVALVLGLAFGLVLFVVMLLIQVPFQTFLRYYALLVLGDTNDDFDVIPDARAAVRADGGDDVDGDAGTEPGDGDGPDDGPGGAGTDARGVDATDGSATDTDDVGWDVDSGEAPNDGAPSGESSDDDVTGDETSGTDSPTRSDGESDSDTDDGWNVDRDDRS